MSPHTSAELAEVEAALQQLKSAGAQPPTNPAQFLGSLTGVMKFGPDWDTSLPLEDWDALRDGSSP